MAPVTRYARSGEASIAYQVTGDGALDLLFMPGWISQIEQLWESPALRRWLERLAGFSRLILFDRRGSGLSDSVGEAYTLEQEARDALAVLDAVGSERAALFTYGLGGPVGALLAADRPRAGGRADHVRVDRAHCVGSRLRLGDDRRGSRSVDRAHRGHVGRGRRSRPSGDGAHRWRTTRRSRRGLRVCNAWRRARARPASSSTPPPSSTCATRSRASASPRW